MAQVTNTLNSRYQVQGDLEIERLHLHPLPMERFADYEPGVARVRSTSTIELRSITTSVPSRLIGQQLTVHLRHDRGDSGPAGAPQHDHPDQVESYRRRRARRIGGPFKS